MTEEIRRVDFLANPIQKLFIESHARADLFASRMGEGKSAGLCWAIVYHTRHNPGASWAFIRDTWENLRDTSLVEFLHWFPAGIFGTWKASDKTYTWRGNAVGLHGRVYFLGMDDERDSAKLQSRPLAGIAIDEPAPAADSVGVSEMIFDVGLSRLRQKGMNWYAVKLATNNPDETHWTHRRFVDPGTSGFMCFQPKEQENKHNLPPGYYEQLASDWAHRPDLRRRFIEGKFGFQQIGKAVAKAWSDQLHLASQLQPITRRELILLWDFGLNPTCVISQVTPAGVWNILQAFGGDGIGVEELIEDDVLPALSKDYPWALGSKKRGRKAMLRHIGDSMGKTPEASSSNRSAVKTLRRMLGGSWRDGPVPLADGVGPLNKRLSKVTIDVDGRPIGVIRVDRLKAKIVWHALRGGWHFKVSNTGMVSREPNKLSVHSHPGDCMRYGAGVLFPMGDAGSRRGKYRKAAHAKYFEATGAGAHGRARPGLILPKETRIITRP
ncbi:MAG: hypothetical protein ACR2QC_07960 [Gammaproteobacteria bacterium]